MALDNNPQTDALVQRLADEDLLGQLLNRAGRMRELGDEGGDLKLDWVDGVEQALAHPEWLAAVAEEAQAILDAGIQRVIWSGMGGSVQTVYCLQRMGYLDLPNMSIHPLDSTDPASVNRLLREIAAREGLALDGTADQHREAIGALLRATMMTGVSMGMTSEEPITHLEWFDGLLREYGVARPEEHLQVMTLPGSYLDRFARERHARTVPIQLDGESHTPGRMSAPATRVFLRPVALALAAAPDATPAADRLRALLERCQARYGVTHAADAAARRARTLADPFIRLGAFMAEGARRGRNKLVLVYPPSWRGLAPWVEQLVEESLGKGGKGWLIFYDQPLAALRDRADCAFLALRPEGAPLSDDAELAALQAAGRPVLTLDIPLGDEDGLPRGLPELAAQFASWKLAIAAFGYASDIVIAGQPAVEGYKTYARELRDGAGAIPLPSPAGQAGELTADVRAVAERLPGGEAHLRERVAALGGDAARTADQLAAILLLAREQGWLRYLDLTYNGEVDATAGAALEEGRQTLATALGLPVKVRTGPSDYHSTEQSETDGPLELVSLRFVAAQHAVPLAGRYSDRFLLAQARGTWQAMRDAGRWVVLLAAPDGPALTAGMRALWPALAARLTAAAGRANA